MTPKGKRKLKLFPFEGASQSKQNDSLKEETTETSSWSLLSWCDVVKALKPVFIIFKLSNLDNEIGEKLLVAIEIPANIVEVLREMDRTKPLEQKFKELITREVEGRILRYEMLVKFFESKYGMNFKDFDERDMVEKLGHTWDVERDYFDWEMAVTELEHLKEALRRLTSN